MTTTTKELKLDVGQKPTLKYVYAKQGDRDTRFVRVRLVAGENNVTLQTGDTAKIRALLPNGTTAVENVTINIDGTITAELSETMLANKGIAKADIAVFGTSGKVLSSEVFIIKVQEALIL